MDKEIKTKGTKKVETIRNNIDGNRNKSLFLLIKKVINLYMASLVENNDCDGWQYKINNIYLIKKELKRKCKALEIIVKLF